MKPGGGKQKGADFERTVCWDLSRFIDPDDTETYFWRSAMSGGRATLHNRAGIINSTQIGDISCIHEKGRWLTEMFAIECKHVAHLNITSGLLLGRGELKKFWREISKIAAKHYNRSPMLIARQNRLPTIVLFDSMGIYKLKSMGRAVPVILQSETLRNNRTTFVCLYDEVFK